MQFDRTADANTLEDGAGRVHAESHSRFLASIVLGPFERRRVRDKLPEETAYHTHKLSGIRAVCHNATRPIEFGTEVLSWRDAHTVAQRLLAPKHGRKKLADL